MKKQNKVVAFLCMMALSISTLTGCMNSDASGTGESANSANSTDSDVTLVSSQSEVDGSFTVEVSVPDDYEGELNGRLLIAFTKDVESKQPYEQLNATGVPVFGKTFYGLNAGDVMTMNSLDEEILGFPFTMDELPEEDLYMQAFFIKYTEFERDGLPAIWGMDDHGGGGNYKKNPYNLYSDYELVSVSDDAVFNLSLDNEIELGYELEAGEVTQQGNYEDTDMVKYVKIKSEVLSEFWGTDIYLGANVLLPTGYDENKEYAALYYQGHWPSGNAPLSYGTNEDLTAYWDSDEAPNMVAITFRDANMFYDTSYSVDSANLGPWGEAITTELIPYLEEEFNLIDESWARMLSGGSTGGWESLAMQIFYPDYFGGTWSLCPDSVDFNHYQVVNIYEDDNAYYTMNGDWLSVERPGSVSLDGNVRYMMKDEMKYESAVGGLETVSLGQWAIWETLHGPVDDDGYPKRLVDPLTGEIDKDTAEYWKNNFDLNYYLQQNWSEIGEDLVGKIHLRGGDMDAYYLNHSQYLMGEFLESTTEPYYDGYSVTFARKGHTGNITSKELILEMCEQMTEYGPANAQAILFN